MAKKKISKPLRLWVEALESGKYGWGKNHLRPTPDQFCCLGVLCEVAKAEGVIDHYEWNHGFLPAAVQNWSGVSYGGDVGQANLLEINDTAKTNPFKKIARLIVKNSPEVENG